MATDILLNDDDVTIQSKDTKFEGAVGVTESLWVGRGIVSPWQCHFEDLTTEKATIRGNLVVNGDAIVHGKVAATGDAEVRGDLRVENKIWVKENIISPGQCSLGYLTTGGFTATGNADVKGDLKVEKGIKTGYASIDGVVKIGNIEIHGTDSELQILPPHGLGTSNPAPSEIQPPNVTHRKTFLIISPSSIEVKEEITGFNNKTTTLDLVAEIKALRNEVDTLRKKVNELQANPH